MLPMFLTLVKVVPLAFVALFPVVNPFGTAIILAGMTGTLDRKTRHVVAAKIAINTAVLLTVVVLAGSYLLAFFGLTIPIIEAAGGFVLASMGWKMLNQEESAAAAPTAGSPSRLTEMLFYPFTFPITVGPGCIAVTLTLSAHSQHEGLAQTALHQGGVIVGIIGVAALMFVSFAYSDQLEKRLGPSGTKVTMRLMAFVLVCLGAEIFWNGASTLLRQVVHS